MSQYFVFGWMGNQVDFHSCHWPRYVSQECHVSEVSKSQIFSHSFLYCLILERKEAAWKQRGVSADTRAAAQRCAKQQLVAARCPTRGCSRSGARSSFFSSFFFKYIILSCFAPLVVAVQSSDPVQPSVLCQNQNALPTPGSRCGRAARSFPFNALGLSLFSLTLM